MAGVGVEVAKRVTPEIKIVLIEVASTFGGEKSTHQTQHPLFLLVAAAERTGVGEVGSNRCI
jgi:hypothetical protein